MDFTCPESQVHWVLEASLSERGVKEAKERESVGGGERREERWGWNMGARQRQRVRREKKEERRWRGRWTNIERSGERRWGEGGRKMRETLWERQREEEEEG